MIAAVLFILFIALMLAGVPIGIALGLGATAAIAMANLDTANFGLLAVPQNFYATLTKYPLLALPMFVLVGSIFDRSGVAQRLINLAIALVGRGPGMLPVVAIAVAMFLGGISGSGPANAAAVGGVMIAAMARAGYPASFSASVIGAAASTDILIPPSIALIIYSVLTPGASVPALFAAGMLPGVLIGLALMIPAVWLSRRHGLGAHEAEQARPALLISLREAFWGLTAPILILGGMRLGWFTPTEAAAVAVGYGLLIGMAIHKTIGVRDLLPIFREAAELSAVILMVIGLASIFAYALSTLSIIDPIAKAILSSGISSGAALACIVILLLIVGMFLDGISIFLIFVPLLTPFMRAFQWDPVWFGILMTMMVAVGQFTPPMAVNLMVSCKMAKVPIDQTFKWVWWFVLAVLIAVTAVVIFPGLALWLPKALGY
ncbi:MAG: TRAP transporter large permease [Burkholderiaceae bacterium]|jgi:C4-dicarboxylate transporter DctM subunit|nr:TRAP transporter large permease [Burkholderiaceae bacterium]